MKKDQMKGNVGSRVQLHPVACCLDRFGRELPEMDDEWIVQAVDDAGIRISNIRTDHVTTLGYDHVHHYTSNPDRSRHGIQYGFLTLLVQVFIQGDNLTIRPTGRPGERVPPAPVRLVEKVVEFNFPTKSGIQQRLEAEGYRVAWARPDKIAALELEGAEVVVEQDAHGVLSSFRLRDGLVLTKRRA